MDASEMLAAARAEMIAALTAEGLAPEKARFLVDAFFAAAESAADLARQDERARWLSRGFRDDREPGQ